MAIQVLVQKSFPTERLAAEAAAPLREVLMMLFGILQPVPATRTKAVDTQHKYVICCLQSLKVQRRELAGQATP